MREAASFEALLHALLRHPVLPPSLRLERSGWRRVRSEFGDFRGHVPYSPGDDLRFLDWNALARSGQRVCRVFDQLEHRRLVLILDLSASMAPRVPGLRRLGQLLVFLGLNRLDSVEVLLCRAGGLQRSLFEGPSNWPSARDLLQGIQAGGDLGFRELVPALEGAAKGVGRLLVSDFQPPAEALELLAALADLGQSLLCLFPRLPFEARGGPGVPAGPRRLFDPESSAELPVHMRPGLLLAFREEQEAWEGRMSGLARDLGHDFLAATLPGPGDEGRAEAWLPFLTFRDRGRA